MLHTPAPPLPVCQSVAQPHAHDQDGGVPSDQHSDSPSQDQRSEHDDANTRDSGQDPHQPVTEQWPSHMRTETVAMAWTPSQPTTSRLSTAVTDHPTQAALEQWQWRPGWRFLKIIQAGQKSIKILNTLIFMNLNFFQEGFEFWIHRDWFWG